MSTKLPITSNILISEVVAAEIIEDINGTGLAIRIKLKNGEWIIEAYTTKLFDALKFLKGNLICYSITLEKLIEFHQDYAEFIERIANKVQKKLSPNL